MWWQWLLQALLLQFISSDEWFFFKWFLAELEWKVLLWGGWSLRTTVASSMLLGMISQSWCYLYIIDGFANGAVADYTFFDTGMSWSITGTRLLSSDRYLLWKTNVPLVFLQTRTKAIIMLARNFVFYNMFIVFGIKRLYMLQSHFLPKPVVLSCVAALIGTDGMILLAWQWYWSII